MTTEDAKRCSAYDQIAGRTCRYYAGHGGRHNFARLDHDCSLERELRRALDEMTKARDEACDIAAMAESHSAVVGHKLKRIAELRKVGSP